MITTRAPDGANKNVDNQSLQRQNNIIALTLKIQRQRQTDLFRQITDFAILSIFGWQQFWLSSKLGNLPFPRIPIRDRAATQKIKLLVGNFYTEWMWQKISKYFKSSNICFISGGFCINDFVILKCISSWIKIYFQLNKNVFPVESKCYSNFDVSNL